MDNISKVRHQQLFWLILGCLLFLRIPYTISIIYFLPIENEIGAAVYEVGAYLLIAILIWLERDCLADYYMDTPALFLILLLRPLQTIILSYWRADTPMAFPNPCALFVWTISIGLIFILWRSGFKIQHIPSWTWKWLVFGLLIGIGVSVSADLGAFRNISAHSSATALISTSLNLLYHLGFAPINEEPLFRGFLWGALRKLNWKNGWILIFQAVLFTSAHIYFVNYYPFRFWIFIPAMGLLFGFLALRSRSISPGILAHGIINGSAYIFLLNIVSLIR